MIGTYKRVEYAPAGTWVVLEPGDYVALPVGVGYDQECVRIDQIFAVAMRSRYSEGIDHDTLLGVVAFQPERQFLVDKYLVRKVAGVVAYTTQGGTTYWKSSDSNRPSGPDWKAAKS